MLPFAAIILFSLFAAGLIVAAIGLRGRPVLSAPRCAKCDYDLRNLQFMSSDALPPCPECGANLAPAGAVSFGKWKRSPRLIIVGLLLLLLPVPLIVLVRFAASRPSAVVVTGPGAAASVNNPQALASMTNAQILAVLPTVADSPWAWRELEGRLGRNALSSAEADQAVVALTKFIKARSAKFSGNPQPLSWSDGFIKAAMASGAVTPQHKLEFCQAFFAEPTFTIRRTVRANQPILVDVVAHSPWDLAGYSEVFCLRDIAADDGATKLTPTDVYGPRGKAATKPAHPDTFSGSRYVNFHLSIAHSLPPGDHELTITSDLGAIPLNSTPRGLDGKPGTPDKWPAPLAKWTATTRPVITVIPAAEPLVKLVTDPAADPFATCTIKLVSCAVRPATDGTDLLLNWTMAGWPKIAIAMRVTLRAGDRSFPAGTLTVVPQKSGSNNSYSISYHLETPLPPDVRTVIPTLTPDASLAESLPSVSEIWASPKTLGPTTLDRFDLPAASQQ